MRTLTRGLSCWLRFWSLLVMGAIAGLTIYRRYYENSFNQGGRNDFPDDHPNDGCHQRGNCIFLNCLTKSNSWFCYMVLTSTLYSQGML